MSSEKSIMNLGLVATSSVPETMCWRNNTGVAWQGARIQAGAGSKITVQPGMVILADSRPIRFGLVGSGDVLGVTSGMAWAHEYKSASGAQREDQLKFERAFTRAGGAYRLIRSAADAEAHIREILGGK
jgi:hypothetical protein